MYFTINTVWYINYNMNSLPNDYKSDLVKVLTEHREKDSPFYRTMVDLMNKQGFAGLLGALAGPILVTYPDINMPNGTKTQTITSTGVAAGWYFVASKLITNSSDYNVRFTLNSNGNNVIGNPKVMLVINDSPVSSLIGTAWTGPFFGVSFALGTKNGVVSSGVLYNTTAFYSGTSSVIDATTYNVCSDIEVKENNGLMNIMINDVSMVQFTYSSGIWFSGPNRYIHLYKNDNANTGSSLTIGIGTNLIS